MYTLALWRICMSLVIFQHIMSLKTNHSTVVLALCTEKGEATFYFNINQCDGQFCPQLYMCVFTDQSLTAVLCPHSLCAVVIIRKAGVKDLFTAVTLNSFTFVSFLEAQCYFWGICGVQFTVGILFREMNYKFQQIVGLPKKAEHLLFVISSLSLWL